jgi:hypothetical protein
VLCCDLKGEQMIYIAGFPYTYPVWNEMFKKSYENFGIWKYEFYLGTLAFF